ncbi:MAG: hypothetical protein L0216_13725 [Planctomycetales bacterium]|nr:hypothetical protein [Planctomycetales bacterium]
MQLRLGDPDAASADFREALRLRPDSPDAPAIRARLATAEAMRGGR